MANTEIAFKFISNGQIKLQTNGSGNLKDIVYQLYGKEISKALCNVDYEKNGIKIRGVVARPEVTRSSRSLENIFVNGRYIKDNIISKAVEDGFGDRLMQHQYPFCALNFELNGVDVNVHPRKMEVRFSDRNFVYDNTKEAVEEIFITQSAVREVPVGKALNEKKVFVNTPEPFENKRRDMSEIPEEVLQNKYEDVTKDTLQIHSTGSDDEIKWTLPKENMYNPKDDMSFIKDENTKRVYSDINDLSNKSIKEVNIGNIDDVNPSGIKPSQLSFFESESKKYMKVIGQVFDTYWIVQLENEMYIIDQHAAHEKVMYERLLKESKANKLSSQMINPPIIVTLTDLEQNVLKEHMDEFRGIGFDIEEFGGKEYKINAIPNIFPSIPKAELFNEMLSDSTNYDVISPSELILAKVASMSCKAAIKGNMRISLLEANELFDELLSLDNPYNCPHGRPTVIKMTKQEIEKKFKRIV